MNLPEEVTAAAAAFCDAVEAARAAGYRIDVDLGRVRGVPVSATGSVAPEDGAKSPPAVGRAAKSGAPS